MEIKSAKNEIIKLRSILAINDGNGNLFKLFIILLYLIPNYEVLNIRYKPIKTFSYDNEIRLKVKGIGYYPVILSDYRPSSIELNGTKIGSNTNIQLPNYINDVRLKFSNALLSCESMFSQCSQIIEIDLTNFISTKVGNIDYMFNGCSSLKSIKFGNFKTSGVNKMSGVFHGCTSLESLNLSSFDTSSVTDFQSMFSYCKSLKSLDLSNFKTSKLIMANTMFSECISLTSINLSSFNTPRLKDMTKMFGGCKSLTSLDLSSFDTSGVIDMRLLFENCENLEFVNLIKATTSSLNSYNNMISNTAKNIVFCATKSKTSILNNLIKGDNCKMIISNCSNWLQARKKIVYTSGQCVDKCPTDFPFEYSGKCYNECPERTVSINYICTECSSDCKECLNTSLTFCKSCIDSNKFLYNGTCVESCSYGNFSENSKKICCNLEKCSQCNKESFGQNLCTACNNGFNPKYEEKINNTIFDCYKDLDGYYLEKIEEKFYYQKCYKTCDKCDIGGNSTFHNCKTCSVKYSNEMIFDKNNNINCYQECPYYFYKNKNSNKIICTYNYSCNDPEYNKLMIEKEECTNNCSEQGYKYEFRNQCYMECPKGTLPSKTKQNYCDILCSKDYPFEVISTPECVSFCKIDDINKKCFLNYENIINASITEINEKLLQNIKKDLTNGYNISNIDNGIDTFILGINSNISISNIYNQINQEKPGQSTIDFTNCEKSLKLHYNISLDKSLYILKVDVQQIGMKISKTVYEVYYPYNNTNLIILNLSVCQNDAIVMYQPAIINNNENLDKYDLNSDYYKDLCYSTTSDYGTDINLKDRTNNFFDNNLTLCAEDCTLIEYNKTTNKSKCSCNIMFSIPFFKIL